LGTGQWEGPFSPSPIVVEQAEEVPLSSSWILLIFCRVSALRDRGCAGVGSVAEIEDLLAEAESKGSNESPHFAK